MSARHTPAAATEAGGRSSRTRLLAARAAAWTVVCVYAASVLLNIWLGRISGVRENPAEGVVIFLGFGMFAAVGALLVAKRPANLFGWILVSVSMVVPVYLGELYAAYVMSTGGEPGPLAVFGAWVNSWYWYLTLGLAFLFLPMLFPDGRLLSGRWLPVAALTGAGVVGAAVLSALAETLTGSGADYRIENPIGIEGLGYVEELPVFGALSVIFIVGGVAAVASVVLRFRRSRGVERQQMKWFLYAAAPILLFTLTDFALEIVGALVFGWVLVGLPAAIGIAVLRYRLYDIDILINRTLVYGALTVTLALVYVGGVVGLQRVFIGLSGQESQLAVVASTLAIVALFVPLRRRVQAFVDRLFYRNKYDAARVLAAFGARLRDETELSVLSEDLVSVARETMQSEHASLWLRQPGERRG